MDEIKQIAINQIVPSKTNPRTQFDEGKLNELAKSIKKSGVVQPLLVRHLSGTSYELIAGERRLRASQRAGLVKVPCVVRDLSESVTEVKAEAKPKVVKANGNGKDAQPENGKGDAPETKAAAPASNLSSLKDEVAKRRGGSRRPHPGN